jgi:endonuclease/exonuclease/phosphatase family metal-dependent hydrolase
LQYNIQKSREVVLTSLFQDPGVLKYDILAIQEPWRNPYIYTSYHPLKRHFQLTYLADATMRACLYINKRLDPSTWSVSYVSKDIISLTIRNPTAGKSIHIVNVYNEVGTNTLQKLRETIGALDPPYGIMVLGDFNLHHPLWSAKHRRTGEGQSAQELITIIEDLQLQLLTVPGTPTHQWKDGESTLDLTFASEDLAPRIIHCKIDRSLDYDSDHLPITLAID